MSADRGGPTVSIAITAWSAKVVTLFVRYVQARVAARQRGEDPDQDETLH
jgi:hypothetical protein